MSTLQPETCYTPRQNTVWRCCAADDTVELIVNGIFAMDSEEVSSEIALADAVGPGPKRVLVGGLGLGYTPARLLELGASRVDVVELAGPLLEWAAAGVTDQLARIVADPRVRLHHADIADFVPRPGRGTPSAGRRQRTDLPHPRRERAHLQSGHAGTVQPRLAPGGAMLVWAEQPSPGLWRTLRELDPGATETILPTFRGERTFNYALTSVEREHRVLGEVTRCRKRSRATRRRSLGLPVQDHRTPPAPLSTTATWPGPLAAGRREYRCRAACRR